MKSYLTLALAGLALVACNEDADRSDPCNDTNTFLYADVPYCIVIEEGFLETDCPSDLPNGRKFQDFVACTDGDSVPDEVETEARSRGFGTDNGPCTDGQTRTADDGCNSCVCEDGAWSCTEIGCTPVCTDGETRPADDGCNTCSCSSGIWTCTALGCVSPLEVCLDTCEDCEASSDPRVSYVGESPEACSVIDYTCPTTATGFSNECGCGCVELNTTACTDGDTMGTCDECTCTSGEWTCEEPTCLDACLENCDSCLPNSPPEIGYVGTAEQCMTIDYQCDEGFDSFSNACGCGCVSLDPQTCVDGDTRMESCNECVCSDGTWQCDTADCSELDACLADCGEGCPAPEFQVCTTSGMSVCSECEAECRDLPLATNRQPCECPSLPGERVAYELFEVPDTCTPVNDFGTESAVAFSNEDAAAWFNCDPATTFDIETGGGVLIRSVHNERPSAIIEGVYRDRVADTLTVFLTSSEYCGGAGPTDSVFYVLASFGDETRYSTETCTHTRCTEFFP
jgi:hypothetical protein